MVKKKGPVKGLSSVSVEDLPVGGKIGLQRIELGVVGNEVGDDRVELRNT